MENFQMSTPNSDIGSETLHVVDFFLMPLAIYLTWQAFYLLVQFNYIDKVSTMY
jgi:hypothetical protein